MWTFSELGFASAVEDRTNDEFVIVRFRDPKDASDHAKMHKAANGRQRTPSVWRDERADYFWRMRVRKSEWAETIAIIATGIDYPNFKSMMHQRADHWTGRELMNVWATTNSHQQDIVENEAMSDASDWELPGGEFADNDRIVDAKTGVPEPDENPFE